MFILSSRVLDAFSSTCHPLAYLNEGFICLLFLFTFYFDGFFFPFLKRGQSAEERLLLSPPTLTQDACDIIQSAPQTLKRPSAKVENIVIID